MRLIDADNLENITVVKHSDGRLKRIDAPTVDAEPVVHGEWYYDPDGMDWGLGAWRCNQCHVRNANIGGGENVIPLRWSGSKFCPNCGAKMMK